MSKDGEKERVGVAVFGLGRAGGEYHVPGLAGHPEVEVRWLVDVAGAMGRAEELCRRYQLPRAQFQDAESCQPVFDDPCTQAVIVTAPTRFHEDIIKKAVAAGKHVFCEKPIAFTADVVKSCYEEAQRHGRVLFCGFNRRFERHHLNLKEAVQSGSLGQPRVVHYNARDANTSMQYVQSYIKESGGIFCDSAIHQLDYVLWLLGGERPLSVTVLGGCGSREAAHFRACGDLDQVMISLQFPGPVQAHIQVLREVQRDFPYFRMEVVGTEGTSFSHKVTTGTLSTQRLDGSGQEVRSPMDFDHSYQGELHCFIRVVQGKEECPVLAEEVILASHLADLCLTSLKEQRTVKV